MYQSSNTDSELARELRQIEEQHLSAQLTETQKAKPELVSSLMKEIILPALQENVSGVAYTGSAYEYTAIPGKSDFDIQCYIKLPYGSAYAQSCENPSWSQVRGGPSSLVQGGYLSTTAVRALITSKIDRAVSQANLKFKGSPITVRRSVSGPATTLNVEWKGETLSIDIVACLKAEDVGNSAHDLVGKPYGGRDTQPSFWRLSYSRQELEKLKGFHSTSPRKLTLLRIMKVIKQHNPQFNQFPSYFYKNILFMLNDQKPSSYNWERSELAARFKDMIEKICDVLEKGVLPVYFNPRVNYLAGYERSTIRQVANYLRGNIRNNQYVDLVRRVSQHSHYY